MKYIINSQQAFEMKEQIQNLAPNVRQNNEEGCTKQAQVDGRRTSVALLLDILNANLLSAWYADRSAVNEARAMRVAEVINDFHLIQRKMSQYQATPSPDEYHEEGYEVLRQCRAEAQAVLAAPFQNELLQVPRGPGEAEKRQLQQ